MILFDKFQDERKPFSLLNWSQDRAKTLAGIDAVVHTISVKRAIYQGLRVTGTVDR